MTPISVPMTTRRGSPGTSQTPSCDQEGALHPANVEAMPVLKVDLAAEDDKRGAQRDDGDDRRLRMTLMMLFQLQTYRLTPSAVSR